MEHATVHSYGGCLHNRCSLVLHDTTARHLSLTSSFARRGFASAVSVRGVVVQRRSAACRNCVIGVNPR